MYQNNVTSGALKKSSSVARNVRILLVDHDTTSLMSLTSRFEQQSYKVTTAESTNAALSLFTAQKNYFNIVIVDRSMPDIYEFVHEIHNLGMDIPIMLIDENYTVDSTKEAMDNGVCYIFGKPLRHCDIANLWQHICRVTGEMPSPIDMEKYENIKTRKSKIAEDSNSSVDPNKEDGFNSKKSRVTWTPFLHQNFLKAIDSLGEHAAHPKMILSMMNAPGLTYRQVSSHLQKHRSASPVMPIVPAEPLSIFVQGKTSGTANLKCIAEGRAPQIPRSPIWLEAQNVKGYGLDSVKEKLDSFTYSGNNAIIANRGVHITGGSGRAEIDQGIDPNHDSTSENYVANITEQANVIPRRFGLGDMEFGPEVPESCHLSTGLQALYHDPAGETDEMIPSSSLLSSGLQTPNRAQAGAISDVVVASGHLSTGLQAPNQELAGDFAVGMYGLGNVGNPINMDSYSFGEGTSANPLLDDLPSEDDVNNMIQDLEASDLLDWINQN